MKLFENFSKTRIQRQFLYNIYKTSQLHERKKLLRLAGRGNVITLMKMVECVVNDPFTMDYVEKELKMHCQLDLVLKHFPQNYIAKEHYLSSKGFLMKLIMVLPRFVEVFILTGK